MLPPTLTDSAVGRLVVLFVLVALGVLVYARGYRPARRDEARRPAHGHAAERLSPLPNAGPAWHGVATNPREAKPMAFKERVFSGVQPTGNLHLGNYLGAIVKFVALQERYDCIYCVVDMHAITVWQDPTELPRATREVTAAFIACGIDPKKHIVFNQSQVAEHAELAWVFNCVARMGWLNRMTQFKEKAGKDRENASVGLYVYPNLMAADILVYRATHVPVGEDQKQHLELVARHRAEVQQRLSRPRSTRTATAMPSSRCRSRSSRARRRA